MGQRTYRGYISVLELKEILNRGIVKFGLTLMGREWNSMHEVDLDVMGSDKSLNYSDFALSFTGEKVDSSKSWKRGDVNFCNVVNVFGYLDVLQMAVRFEPIEVGNRPEAVNVESYKVFQWISREIRRISNSYDDLCVLSTGAKLKHKTFMTKGSRELLLSGTLLTGGNSPTRKPVVIIGLCELGHRKLLT